MPILLSPHEENSSTTYFGRSISMETNGQPKQKSVPLVDISRCRPNISQTAGREDLGFCYTNRKFRRTVKQPFKRPSKEQLKKHNAVNYNKFRKVNKGHSSLFIQKLQIIHKGTSNSLHRPPKIPSANTNTVSCKPTLKKDHSRNQNTDWVHII